MANSSYETISVTISRIFTYPIERIAENKTDKPKKIITLNISLKPFVIYEAMCLGLHLYILS